ncbi:hypothetical protein G7Z17_g12622 [Cylindrodendrum hubeiense]|uniref:Uncharacterized protein n=1 Tax=Cylindrodendrum hubeiense TaxID=595255 RepID=A0A9P5GYJ5_9HYPO|nr:hypothetical protein G7Z17_g12622 [Cylindrodendrum hubeiense]
MRSSSAFFVLPMSLLALVSHAAADNSAPTAIKKLAPNSNEKLLAEHLAFAAIPLLSPRDAAAAAAAISFLDERGETVGGITRYRPAFARHFEDAEYNVLRRAAEALALLQRREACPDASATSLAAPTECHAGEGLVLALPVQQAALRNLAVDAVSRDTCARAPACLRNAHQHYHHHHGPNLYPRASRDDHHGGVF